MEAQVDVLEGKQQGPAPLPRRASQPLRRRRSDRGRADWAAPTAAGTRPPTSSDDEHAASPPAVSRLVLAAQEDLRREIARAMHDGPAQSLTNIVLQAQIVERLLDRDPAQRRAEIGQLVAMVQQTLDATKTFIFDVRPMVLDDLGLVPTLRRVARDRGRRAAGPGRVRVVRAPTGACRWSSRAACSGCIDEALAGYLSASPERVAIRLDWARPGSRPGSRPCASAGAGRRARAGAAAGRRDAASRPSRLPAGPRGDDRRAPRGTAASGRRAARASRVLPATAWREIQQRAATLGRRGRALADGPRSAWSTVASSPAAPEPAEPAASGAGRRRADRGPAGQGARRVRPDRGSLTVGC